MRPTQRPSPATTGTHWMWCVCNVAITVSRLAPAGTVTTGRDMHASTGYANGFLPWATTRRRDVTVGDDAFWALSQINDDDRAAIVVHHQFRDLIDRRIRRAQRRIWRH